MKKCKQCKKPYEEGSEDYCASCLAKAQKDVLGRWDELEEDRSSKAS